MTIALPQIQGANILTHSRMQCFKTCPRRHYFQYELGIRKDTTSTPLRMGSAFHLGRDLRAKGHTRAEAIDIAVAGYEELPKWATTDDTVREWMYERETVACLLNGYFWWWEEGGHDADVTIVELVESEKAFELPIRNPDTGSASTTFRVAGKRDAIARFADNRIKVLETKTTGDDVTPGSDYWLRLRLDQQISLYMLSAQEDGIDVESVVYDVVKKPTIKPYRATAAESKKYTKDGKLYASMRENAETPEEWRDRLTADIQERPEYYFARREIPRLPSDLDTFRRELWQQAASVRESRNSGRWFRNTGACISPYRCDYLDVCHHEIDVSQPPPGFVRVVNIHPELQEHE